MKDLDNRGKGMSNFDQAKRNLNSALETINKNKLASCAWFVGVASAKGFFSTALACIFPPWGWLLAAEVVVNFLTNGVR